MAGIIPTGATQPDFAEDVDLDRVVYRLSIHYNGRDDSWYLSVADADGVEIVSGVRLVIDTSLLGQHVSEGLPPGVLLIIDPAGTRQDPTRADLDDEGKALVYLDEEELA